jgi:hypothetical protein
MSDVVDVQLSKLIEEAETQARSLAKAQRRHQLARGYVKTRNKQGLDEFSLACGEVIGLRNLAAVVAPSVVEGRVFDPMEVRREGMAAADVDAGLTAELAQSEGSERA